MATVTAGANDRPADKPRIELDHGLHPGAKIGFLVVLLAGIAYASFSIFLDTQKVGETLALGAFAFLGLALVIALGFEFVNGFHDTANAVATVIYTHALKPVVAVVWSGTWNFIGVLTSSGAVAYSIITLLPVDLILGVGSAGGYAMIFALLLAAVTWNLGTWWFGLPNSSSHALIGSILGVGVANQFLAGPGGTSGVEWSQATNVLLALLVSPVIGFVGSYFLLKLMKKIVPDPKLYEEPKATRRRRSASIAADLHVHRGVVRPWRQRRAEGHGPDHADPDRRRADRVRAQPDHARQLDPGVHPVGDGRSDRVPRQGRRVDYRRRQGGCGAAAGAARP